MVNRKVLVSTRTPATRSATAMHHEMQRDGVKAVTKGLPHTSDVEFVATLRGKPDATVLHGTKSVC